MTTSPPNSAGDGADASLQLELFPDATASAAPGRPGLSAAVARAGISPGWWPLVRHLFQEPGIVVHACEERDGALLLDASSEDDSPALAAELEGIRQRASTQCGCCGLRRGEPFRARLDTPTVRVCEVCRERLRAGQSYLRIADDHWHLDGSVRMVARSVIALARPAAAPLAPPVRPCLTMSADELRATVADFREQMGALIMGHEEQVTRLALMGALHVGGGLSLGQRALILGPSGTGKTSIVGALRRVLEPWGLPWVEAEALSLTSPGWTGVSIAILIDRALGNMPLDSDRARRTVVVVDELHHARVVPDATGNMAAKRAEVLASLLGLAGHGTLHFEDGRQWSSAHALVIGMGAFTDLIDYSRIPSPRALIAAGIPLELATRLGEPLVLHRLSERALVALLRRWPALLGLADVCARLGYVVRIVDEAYARAARVVTLGYDRSTPRTAGEWLVSALRQALIAALTTDAAALELVITPDCLPVSPTAMRELPPDEPPDSRGGSGKTLFPPPR